MTLRRLVVRGLVSLSVFALLASLLVAYGIRPADDGQLISRGVPAEVRDRAVPVMPRTDRAPAPTRTDDDHADETPAHEVADTVVAQLPSTNLAKFSLLGVTWEGGLRDDETVVEVRWRKTGAWSDWTELHVDPSDEGTPGTEPYWVGSANAAQVRVLSTSGAEPRGVQLTTIDPGRMPTFTTAAAMRTAASTVSRPTIISRASWGASNTGKCDSPIYGSTLRGVVIHHTAGSNTEPKSRSAAVVKATQAYHVNSRDWCDIGYNFLVDRFGQIFEGRKGGVDKVVRAAHSGNGAVNQETSGISLMGTFTSAQPPAEMKSAVVRLTAWKLGLHGVQATGRYSLGGKTLNRIAGHRDVVSTACPGATVYAWLTSTASTGLRSQVETALANGGTGEALPTPANLRSTSASSSALRLDWDDVAGAERYHVKLSTSSSMSRPFYRAFTQSKGLVSGLEAGTRYYFAVAVVDSAGKARLSDYTKAPYPSGTTANTSTTDSTAVGSSGTVSLTGHGFGHGIGMSQYGAQNAALKGKSWGDIIRYYYPGIAGSTLKGAVRVLISADTTISVVVLPASGLGFRNVATGKLIALPKSVTRGEVTQWRITTNSGAPAKSVLQYRWSGGWRTYLATEWTGDGQFEATAPITLVLPSGTAKYRGALRSAPPSKGSTTRDTINVLPVEDYLRGVVPAEMPTSWHQSALKAQSVAARTYMARGLTPSRHYDLCDTTSCQVYRGTAVETSNTDKAIKDTAGRIVTYDGKPAFTQFSSSSGGYSAAGSAPYLKLKVDEYDDWSGNPNHDWTKKISASTIEKAYPTIGTLKSLKITERTGGGAWGGRVTTLVLTGSKGTKSISGADARSKLGLKSTWFRF